MEKVRKSESWTCVVLNSFWEDLRVVFRSFIPILVTWLNLNILLERKCHFKLKDRSPDGAVGNSGAAPANHFVTLTTPTPKYSVPSRAFSKTRLRMEPTIYHSQGGHSTTRPLSWFTALRKDNQSFGPTQKQGVGGALAA